jgi:hypothetical protein
VPRSSQKGTAFSCLFFSCLASGVAGSISAAAIATQGWQGTWQGACDYLIYCLGGQDPDDYSNWTHHCIGVAYMLGAAGCSGCMGCLVLRGGQGPFTTGKMDFFTNSYLGALERPFGGQNHRVELLCLAAPPFSRIVYCEPHFGVF